MLEAQAGETETQQRVRQLFASMDTDESGWVDRGELREGLRAAGVADDEAVEQMLHAADLDGDGPPRLPQETVPFGVSLCAARTLNASRVDPGSPR